MQISDAMSTDPTSGNTSYPTLTPLTIQWAATIDRIMAASTTLGFHALVLLNMSDAMEKMREIALRTAAPGWLSRTYWPQTIADMTADKIVIILLCDEYEMAASRPDATSPRMIESAYVM